jgi:two-component system, chemotaxis family, sensor kinase CheA
VTDPSRYAELFRSEAREHLGTLTRLLLLLEREPDRPGVLEELFRSVHTLKGSSAAMGYEAASELAHGLEHLLARMREGSVRADAAVVDLLLQGADALETAVDRPSEPPPAVILDRLGAYAAVDAAASSADPPAPLQPARAGASGPVLRVTVRLDREVVLPAVRAAMALRVARELGEVVEVVPTEAAMLAGELEGAFSFAVVGEVDSARLEEAVRGVGEVESVEMAVDVVGVGVGEPTAARTPSKPARAGAIVRVPQVRLDALVDQVGELMIARDRLRRAAAAEAGSELEESLDAVSRLIEELREEIMRLRMVPVGEVFDRFPRMVRDAARALDRKVELEISGRDEEVDRGLLNEVADLLVHLLRNAVDHGIEPPREREKAGKPPAGRIRVSASREGSTVRIEVRDDGRGLQRERILEAAAERGLLPARGGDVSDAELWGLLTTAGFSTSERITDVSGRGVGLDMVRSRVQALGGSLEIRSEVGKGAAFALRLPLSLTLVRALRLRAGGAYYSIPLSGIVEVAEVAEHDGRTLKVRDEILPALDLRRLLASGVAGEGEEGEEAVVVIEFGGRRAGLIVEGLEGQHQAVVKPFDAPRPMVEVFSGATILPDGRPSLILDPARCVARATTEEADRSATDNSRKDAER